MLLKFGEQSGKCGPFGFAGSLTTSGQSTQLQALPGEYEETGPPESKVGPKCSDPPSSWKYAQWEGPGVLVALKELSVGSSSFWERGGKDYTKLGDERKKRTK